MRWSCDDQEAELAAEIDVEMADTDADARVEHEQPVAS
jgi:hypothetical protein